MGYSCDNCGSDKVRRIETGGGSGIFLCDPCLKKEIEWRKMRNKELIKHYGGKDKVPKDVLFRTNYKIPIKNYI